MLSFVVLVACGARTELDRPLIPYLCGNGVLDPGEQCDLGSSNSDTPVPFLVSQSGGESFDVMPLERAESAVGFYDYIGASSHDGLEVLEESRLFLYLDGSSSNLSLIINHNIFGQGTGSANASADTTRRNCWRMRPSTSCGGVRRNGS